MPSIPKPPTISKGKPGFGNADIDNYVIKAANLLRTLRISGGDGEIKLGDSELSINVDKLIDRTFGISKENRGSGSTLGWSWTFRAFLEQLDGDLGDLFAEITDLEARVEALQLEDALGNDISRVGGIDLQVYAPSQLWVNYRSDAAQAISFIARTATHSINSFSADVGLMAIRTSSSIASDLNVLCKFGTTSGTDYIPLVRGSLPETFSIALSNNVAAFSLQFSFNSNASDWGVSVTVSSSFPTQLGDLLYA